MDENGRIRIMGRKKHAGGRTLQRIASARGSDGFDLG
jgi:hypothetical protein